MVQYDPTQEEDYDGPLAGVEITKGGTHHEQYCTAGIGGKTKVAVLKEFADVGNALLSRLEQRIKQTLGELYDDTMEYIACVKNLPDADIPMGRLKAAFEDHTHKLGNIMHELQEVLP